MLDELDWELEQRGHHFVRYADDCTIYVRSERAGQRVMASITRFIERRLRLQVNGDKSAVARPEERHFGTLDAHIRRRLRAIMLKHWKRRRTMVKRLITLGVRPRTAWRVIYRGRQGTWALSHCFAVERGLNNAYFAAFALFPLKVAWEDTHSRAIVTASGQYLLPWDSCGR